MIPDINFAALAGVCIAIGVVIGGILMYLIPWLWSLVKPWLHMVTA